MPHLFTLANDHEPLKVNGGEEFPHGVHGCLIGGILVASPNKRGGADGGGLGGPHQLHGQVPVGVNEQFCRFGTGHYESSRGWSGHCLPPA